MDFTKGEKNLFYIKKNNIWIPVGCLTAAPLSEDVEMIDTTTRDNAGWRTSLPTNQGYSLALNGLVKRDDEDSGNVLISYREMVRLKRDKVLVEWKRVFNNIYADTGKAYITSVSDSDNAGDYVTFNANLVGFGKFGIGVNVYSEMTWNLQKLLSNDGVTFTSDIAWQYSNPYPVSQGWIFETNLVGHSPIGNIFIYNSANELLKVLPFMGGNNVMFHKKNFGIDEDGFVVFQWRNFPDPPLDFTKNYIRVIK